jgi:uncharacterized protein
VLETLDGAAVRMWARSSLAALGRAREEIDSLNVYPVPDADTGTNLFLTFEAATEELAALDPAGDASVHGAAAALGALATGALRNAHGNSGVILSQLLVGIAGEVAAAANEGRAPGPRTLAAALAEGADLAWRAVAVPTEGTMLSVARAAADSARASLDAADGAAEGPAAFASLVEAARVAAAAALDRTRDQLPALRAAGVVDAGGRGLCVLIDVLAALLGGYTPERVAAAVRRTRRGTARPGVPTPRGPAAHQPVLFEVVYLIETDARSLAGLRAEIEAVCAGGGGDSLVIAGREGEYRVHVHVEQPGPVIEAAIRIGSPTDLRVSLLTECAPGPGAPEPDPRAPARPVPGRVVLAVAPGPGIAALFEQAGAVALPARPDRPPTSAQLTRAVFDTGVCEVAVLVNDTEGLAAAWAAAEQAHREAPDVRVAVIPSKAVVQGIAALAVHEPGRRFDADVVAMSAAAGATRYGALQIALDDAWTMAGVCTAGDVLGLIDGDVALIESGVLAAATALADRMVSAGGEMVTLVTGDGLDVPAAELTDAVIRCVQARRPEMDVFAYDGGQSGWPLLIGVE